jgi:hypothetical protein
MTDNQPRYTTKRMHDEIAKARAYARREALEEAAQIAEAEPEFEEEPGPDVIKAMLAIGPVKNARTACSVTKTSIAKAIRALTTTSAIDVALPQKEA